MDIRPEILIVILGSAVATVIPRVAPLVILTRLTLPDWLRAWLGYLPVAILSALLATELVIDGGKLAFKWRELAAILPVFVVAAMTRSLLGAVAAGVAMIAVLRALT
jgi:branched-subunit amino acid transport protein